MPLSFETIQAQTRTFELPYLGEVLAITYRPGEITPEADALPAIEWLPKALVSWDLSIDGAPFPIEVEALKRLPDLFLMDVVKAVLKDAALNPFTSGTSADG